MACWIGKIVSHQPFMRPRRPVLFTSPMPVRSVQSSLANRSRHRASLCFHSVTNCKFCNSFVLIFIQNAGGCTPLSSVPQPVHPLKRRLRKPFVFRSLRTLPFYVWCKSFVCHSYKNCRGVPLSFPFWNSPLVYPDPVESTRHSPLPLSILSVAP